MTKLQGNICDIVDVTSIHLLKVQAVVRAIQAAEDGLDRESLVTLAAIAEDETHKARGELDNWWNGLAAKGRRE